MLRRPATTLGLGQDDITELIAELEEEKLQLRIKSQKRNLVRSGLNSGGTGDSQKGAAEDTEPGDSEDNNSVQISPLDGKRLQAGPVEEGPPTATLTWSNRQVRNRNRDSEHNSEENPFYRDRDL